MNFELGSIIKFSNEDVLYATTWISTAQIKRQRTNHSSGKRWPACHRKIGAVSLWDISKIKRVATLLSSNLAVNKPVLKSFKLFLTATRRSRHCQNPSADWRQLLYFADSGHRRYFKRY